MKSLLHNGLERNCFSPNYYSLNPLPVKNNVKAISGGPAYLPDMAFLFCV